MNSSWKIGRVAGIGIHLHFTFLILLGWVGLSHYLTRRSWDVALSGLAFIIALFTIVVLHELGHALTARRFGIRTLPVVERGELVGIFTPENLGEYLMDETALHFEHSSRCDPRECRV